MFKYVLIAAVCIVAVAARPQAEESKPVLTIVKSDFTNEGNGKFSWDSETSDGTKIQQSGYIKNPEAPADEQIEAISGSYSYPAPDGSIITVTYVADENGFQPKGDHLPTPPPVPEAIQKVVEAALRDAAATQQNAA